MRIVAGKWRGRVLQAPKGHDTRPTADRVREAVFSSLASMGALDDAVVLDAFAGTGALALEALSRGASSATLVERDPGARRALIANIDALGAGPLVRVVPGDAFGLAAKGALPGAPFSLLLLDPPYRIDATRVRDLLGDLADRGVLAPDAVAVWEHHASTAPSWPPRFRGVAERRYGSTGISIAALGE